MMKYAMKMFAMIFAGSLLFLCGFEHIHDQAIEGKQIFESKCAKCHGVDGTRERAGAKNLRMSKLSDTEIIAMITDGKKVMPAFKKKLLPDEIKNVGSYVKSLRK